MQKTKKLAINIIFSVVIIFISLLCIELFLNFLIPQGNPLWGYDSEIGIKFSPDRCTRYLSQEFDVELCANSEGFNDEEFLLEEEPGVTKVAVLGDSLTVAREVERKKRFIDIVEGKLNNRCKESFDFMNFAVAGQGTGLQLLTFKHFAKKYKPDYTFLFIYPENDVADNYLPLLDRDYVPSFRLNEKNQLVEEPFEDAPLISNPVLYAISQRVFPNIFSLFGNAFKAAQAEHYKKDGVPDYLYVYSENESEEYEEAWDLEKEILKELKQEVEDSGSELIVFLVVSYDQAVNLKDYQDNPAINDFNIYKPNKRLETMLKNLDITYFDLLQEYEIESKNYENLHFKYDHHLTEQGHSFVANLIFKDLMKTEICNLECDENKQSCI